MSSAFLRLKARGEILKWGELPLHMFFYIDVIYSMEQSPSWEANRFLASQEISRILWDSKVRYRVYKCPPPVPNLSNFVPVNTSVPLPEDPS
jgi:hypothetical protein